MTLRKRKVTIDTNVFISGIVYGSDTAKKAMDKSVKEDDLMLTNVIYIECVKVVSRKEPSSVCREVEKQLLQLRAKPIEIYLPPHMELKRMYYIRDEDDYRILYSADATDSDLLITGDKDFYDPKLKGSKAKIIKPKDYVNEKSHIKEGDPDGSE
jgi:putative PIN family toxin of toxin-antitoxin system